MGKYKVALSDGRKFLVEADSPPSEQDIYAQLDGGVHAQSPAAGAPTPTPTPAPSGKPADDIYVEPNTGTVYINGEPQTPTDPLSRGLGLGEKGVFKGAASTVASTGELATRLAHVAMDRDLGALTGDHPYTRPFQQFKNEFATPDTLPEKVGKIGEQVGEFFLAPEGKIGQAGKLAQAARGAVTNALGQVIQGGQVDTGTGIAGVLGAAGPAVASAVGNVGSHLQDSARKGLARFLKVTSREKGYDEGMSAINQMLQDGGIVSTSRDKLAQSRQGLATEAKGALDASRVNDANHPVDTMPIFKELFDLRQSLMTPRTAGHTTEPGAVAAIEDRIQNLQDLVDQGGRYAGRDQLESIRGQMDKVYRGGSLPEVPGAAVANKGYGDAIRRTLNADDPQRAQLAKTLSNRIEAADLTANAARKADVSPALNFRTLGGIGTMSAAGAAAGHSLGYGYGPGLAAGIGTTGAIAISRFLRSPLYQTASAASKNAIGEMLSRGDYDTVAKIASRALAGSSAQMTRPGSPEPPFPQDQP